MASVWGELKRRNVVKVAVAYAIVGWLLIEVSSTVLPLFEAPDWIAQVFAFFVILGFPLALILSWAYEITPEGIKLESDVAAGESITHVTGRKLDFAIIGALVLALGFVVYNYVLEDGEVAVGVLPNSVAVLLCDNLSPDPEDAYFALSIHEEILNQLVKIRALNVIARTSVMQYAEARPPIPQIAAELNVGAVVECSVRYAGDAILVTAQLIDPETNSHLWSDTYPGDLSDLSTIFAMQADIAMNIANAVGAEFSFEEQASIEKIPTDSPAAYALYLKAVSEAPNMGNAEVRNRMEPLLLDAVDLDPDFALAYGWLAFVYALRREEALTLEYAEKTLELAPNSGTPYAAKSLMYYRTGRFAEALEFSEQAFQRSPTDSNVLIRYGEALVATGNVEQGIGVYEQATLFNPASTFVHRDLGWARWDSGDREGGIVAVRRSVEVSPESFPSHRALAMMEAALGNRAEGELHAQLAERLDPTLQPGPITAYSYRVAGLNDDAVRLARAWAETVEVSSQAGVAPFFYHLVIDEDEQTLDALMQLIEGPPAVGPPLIWVMSNSFDDPTLAKPEFQALRSELRAKVGWN